MADSGDSKDVKKEEGEDGSGLVKRILYTHPLIRQTDMTEEMKNETMELCATACEKYSNNNESAARLVKETLDRKYGPSWHVVVGESYGLEVTHELQSLLYMFSTGNLAVCIWKCV